MTPTEAIIATACALLLAGMSAAVIVWPHRHRFRRWWNRRHPDSDGRTLIQTGYGWQLATYQQGTADEYTHVTPTKPDDWHTEDNDGECACNPTVRDYENSAGIKCPFYEHRTHDRSSR